MTQLDLTTGITPENAAEAAGGELIRSSGKKITGISIDTRTINPGDLFVAVKGENTDGHRFVSGAADAGASAVLISDPDAAGNLPEGCSAILVPDTVAALGKLAEAHKAELDVLTVAVTGSVGKTTTRQFIYGVLSQEMKTHRTEGNFNNELGLPLSVMKLDGSFRASVLEMGMSAKGEISYLTGIVRPDIAVITNIGTAHIEFLGSREAIRDAKLEIAEGLKPGGRLILNGDEPLLFGIPGAVYCALKNPEAEFRAANICYTSGGMMFSAVCPDRVIKDCLIPTLGEHTVLDAMFAVACGYYAGISDEGIRRGLAAFEAVGMRQNITEHEGITYILDYYNASPESIRASLSVTKELAGKTGGRTVAVIGNVLELGNRSEELHRSVGSFAASLGCDLFFAFGTDASLAAEEAVRDGMDESCVFSFTDISDPAAISEAVKEHTRPGDCILIKASRSIHMERVADILLGK